ncbi:MAG: hypothetical protein QXE76_05935 [Candidatus Bathyarchaeia archaeon]
MARAHEFACGGFWESSHLALGNLIGSNIYNVPLIVGLCGLIREFKMKNSLVVTESAFMIGLSSLFALSIILTGEVTWWVGLIFLSAYSLFIYYSILESQTTAMRGMEMAIQERL